MYPNEKMMPNAELKELTEKFNDRKLLWQDYE